MKKSSLWLLVVLVDFLSLLQCGILAICFKCVFRFACRCVCYYSLCIWVLVLVLPQWMFACVCVHDFFDFLFFCCIYYSIRFRFICLPYRMWLSVHLSWWAMWCWWPFDRNDLHRHYHWFRSMNCVWIWFRATWMVHDTFHRHDSIYLINYVRYCRFDWNVSKPPMCYYYSVSIAVNLHLKFQGFKFSLRWKEMEQGKKEGERKEHKIV